MTSQNTPFQVLLVCTGNICRSAMAEGLLKKLLAQKKGNRISVSSAGIAAGNGNPPSVYAAEVAEEDGVDISRHRSRALTDQIMAGADLVLAMADMHYSWILDMNSDYLHKTYLLKVFGRSKDIPAYRDIPDPFGGDHHIYRQCYQEITTEIKRVLPAIRKLARKKQG